MGPLGPPNKGRPPSSTSNCWSPWHDGIPSLHGCSLILGGVLHVSLSFSPDTISKCPVPVLTEQENGLPPTCWGMLLLWCCPWMDVAQQLAAKDFSARIQPGAPDNWCDGLFGWCQRATCCRPFATCFPPQSVRVQFYCKVTVGNLHWSPIVLIATRCPPLQICLHALIHMPCVIGVALLQCPLGQGCSWARTGAGLLRFCVFFLFINEGSLGPWYSSFWASACTVQFLWRGT